MNLAACNKILVTGGTGFLGGSLIRVLLERGVRPGSIVVPEHSRYDLRHPHACAEAVAGMDLVIHLAANAGGIGWNRKHPGALFYDGQPRRRLDTSRAKEK
jgi:GDP-L-fucose synthase